MTFDDLQSDYDLASMVLLCCLERDMGSCFTFLFVCLLLCSNWEVASCCFIYVGAHSRLENQICLKYGKQARRACLLWQALRERRKNKIKGRKRLLKGLYYFYQLHMLSSFYALMVKRIEAGFDMMKRCATLPLMFSMLWYGSALVLSPHRSVHVGYK